MQPINSRQADPPVPAFRLLAALACGAAMPFAYAPYDLKWLAVLALAGWMLLMLPGRAGAVGYAFGLGWFGLGAWWLAPTLHTFGPLPWFWSGLAVACVGAVLAVFPALLGRVASLLSRGSRGRMLLLLPLLAVGEEWLRGHVFTGLPWTPPGSLLLDTPAIGWAAWLGVYGAAFFPFSLAAALSAVLSRIAPAAGVTALAALLAAGYFAPEPYPADGETHRVALVQGNIPQDEKWDAAFLEATMQRYARLSAEAADRSDVIVWPEAAVPMFLEHNPNWSAWLLERMQAWDKPLLFGGLKLDEEHPGGAQLVAQPVAHNGLFLFSPGSTDLRFVGKRHLVPFGEYVPSWIPFLHRLVPGIADFRPTDDAGVLQPDVSKGGGRYGSLVCYEAIFPEQGRSRAETAAVLVNVTNDAWYGKTPATWQHMQAARMRAVETGRYLLRAANTGVSAIIAPDGRVTATMPWFTTGVVYGEYRDSSARTPYLAYGDALLLPFMLLVLIIMAYPRRFPA